MDDLEGDFDDEGWDAKMAATYGDDFYADDEAAMADGKLALDNSDDEGEAAAAGGGGGAGGGLEKPVFDDGLEELDAEINTKEAAKRAKKARRKAAAEHAAAGAEDVAMDDLYALDYEDVIGGDLKTRFKYRQVKPNYFGFDPAEIFEMDEKELNKKVSLKKLAPYRDEHNRAASKVRQAETERGLSITGMYIQSINHQLGCATGAGEHALSDGLPEPSRLVLVLHRSLMLLCVFFLCSGTRTVFCPRLDATVGLALGADLGIRPVVVAEVVAEAEEMADREGAVEAGPTYGEATAGVEEEVRAEYGVELTATPGHALFDDLTLLVRGLSAVVNNGPARVGGGGDPVVEPPMPLCAFL